MAHLDPLHGFDPDRNCANCGADGVAAHGSLKVAPLNAPAASGHCQRICLQPAGSDAVDIWAVYMPHDMAVRRQVYL